MGAMQYNNAAIWATSTSGTTPAPQSFPSFDQYVNTVSSANLSSANLNEADEMQVYHPYPFDAPFGPGDLEWLYRQQDSDGASLSSRLAELAKISFTNPRDGVRR